MQKTKKTLKTIEENSNGKNIKTIDPKNRKIIKNKKLEILAEKGELHGYEVVKPKKIEKYLRSEGDKTKKNNLDPKIKVNSKKGKNKSN